MADPIIEDIKSKLDIAAIIGSYITLKQSGGNLKGLCPFHGEKTPSFMVNRERQLFRCFGCGESGDVFAFIMKHENIDFASALQLLAAKAGVTLPEKHAPKQSSGNKVEKMALYKVNQIATKFFHQVLRHSVGKAALDYLKSRGVSDASIDVFSIGYAPPATSAMQAVLQKFSLPPTHVKLAGAPDRFRNRLMFPFRDVIGNMVGFSGRALDDQMPKYLNTAETDIFRKNRYLYGLYEAKKHIGTMGKVVMVEGQLDLVLAHQSGVTCAVATSGTALTNDHLTVLRRYSDTLHLAFDGDAAGKKATERAIHLALPHGFEVSVVAVPDGSDPGEMVVKDPEGWQKAVAHPSPAIEWLFHYYFSDAKKTSATEREKIFDALFPYIDLQDDPVSRSYALQRLALLLGVKQEKVITEAFETWKKNHKPDSPQPARDEPPLSSSPAQDANDVDWARRERRCIGLLLVNPALLEYKESHLRAEDFTNPILRNLYTAILSWYNKNTTKSPQDLITYVETTLSPVGKQSLQKLLFDVQSDTADFTPEHYLQEYSVLVQFIRQRLREERIQSFAQQIAQAEQSNDRSRVLDLLRQMQNTP